MSKLQSLRNILGVLLEQGRKLELALVFELMPEEQVASLSAENRKFAEALRGVFKRDYQGWYGNSSALIRHIAPEKHEEFASFFLINPKRRAIEPITEQIRDWFNGTSQAFHQYQGRKFFNASAIVTVFFANQLQILELCKLKSNDESFPGWFAKPHFTSKPVGIPLKMQGAAQS
jgi:hypothetical protein